MNYQQGQALAICAGSATGLLIASLLSLAVSGCTEHPADKLSRTMKAMNATRAPFWRMVHDNDPRTSTWRHKVPGGWLVMVDSQNGCGLCFYSDPEHKWTF